jgi:hypothetical protein
MPAYRFVGAHAKIYDTPYTFSRFGQLVELPEDLARSAVLGRVRLIPAAIWEALGITAEDLQKPGPDLDAKKLKAWAAADEYQASLLAPATQPEPAQEDQPEHIAEGLTNGQL